MIINKDKIRHTFLGELAISCLHIAECRIMPRLMDDETAVKRFYKRSTGRELNLENPQSFSEKMNWYKLNDRNPLMQKCADKVAVREYVKSKGYGDTLNTLLGEWDKVSDIDIDALPDRFVLKASHGSHMNIIVKDNKNEINWKQQKLKMKCWLKQDIYWSGREWVYKDIPKKIIAEGYLEDETGELKDYKLYCFNGKPRYMEYDGNRNLPTQYRNFYDMDMNVLPIKDTVPNKFDDKLPFTIETYKKMQKMASDLSQPFQFARVDLYYVKGKIYFGEITFFDAGGQCNLEPAEWDKKWGEDWELVK